MGESMEIQPLFGRVFFLTFFRLKGRTEAENNFGEKTISVPYENYRILGRFLGTSKIHGKFANSVVKCAVKDAETIP